VPGIIGIDGMSIEVGTSGAVLFGNFLTVPLPLTGSQVFTVSNQANASAGVVIKASSVHLDPIEVSTIACACVRSVEARTCGGVLLDTDGHPAPYCGGQFPGGEDCPPDKACAAVYGPGNSGAGFIGCGDPGFDVDVVQDCNATPGAPPFDPDVIATRREGEPPVSQGSVYLHAAFAISTVVGRCTGTTPEYGPDGIFCTDDDPIHGRGTPTSIALTTNAASAMLIPDYIPFLPIDPFRAYGAPFTCNGEGTPVSVEQANLAGAFTRCDLPATADVAATVNFVCE